MAVSVMYHKVIKYLVNATCTEPLHIGSSLGDKEAVLVHPVDNVPFIQASGIAGVFRSYYEKQYGREAADNLFGATNFQENENAAEHGSKVRFSDGTFEHVILERRPRVKINRATGTCDSGVIQGTSRMAGHRFTMEYIGADASFTFAVYMYAEEQQEALEQVFSAFQQQALQLGGQKSNGCGYIRIDSLYRREFDMTKPEDRKLWAEEEELEPAQYEDITDKICDREKQGSRYIFTVNGQTEGALLVKSMVVMETGKSAPDAANIQNVRKDYIVPASSFKGAVRSQMEMIAEYLGCCDLITEAYGSVDGNEENGKAGCIRFFDTVVGTREGNDMAELSRRIHIDKFTGGVIQGGLFSEKNVSGEVSFRIAVEESTHRAGICGLLLLALRDLAIGTMSIGGGYNVGKGILKLSSIKVSGPDGQQEAELDFVSGNIRDEAGIIPECLAVVNKTEDE